MKRWNAAEMLKIGKKLFAEIHQQKHLANHNHAIHFMARDMDWLKHGVQSMVQGRYTPRHLRRSYFKDEMVDQLHLSDRIFQNILLKQLKPNKLVQDVKKYYDDPKVQAMLENIITNPIETPRGYKNASNGIALRGPLSQFFSGLYLKPLDDAFDNMNVTYLRYQDHILILCKTKRQLNRCRRRMMEVLQARRLSLSRKKTRIGCIKKGFHFLGIDYPPTQTEDNTNLTHADEDVIYPPRAVQIMSRGGGG